MKLRHTLQSAVLALLGGALLIAYSFIGVWFGEAAFTSIPNTILLALGVLFLVMANGRKQRYQPDPSRVPAAEKRRLVILNSLGLVVFLICAGGAFATIYLIDDDRLRVEIGLPLLAAAVVAVGMMSWSDSRYVKLASSDR